MEDFSLVDKLRILMNSIVSSPLFLFCSMLAIAVLIFYIISLKSNNKINKFVFIGIWAFLAIVLLINYNNTFFTFFDNIIDAIFNILYFPSLSEYVAILIIVNFYFFYSIFSKKLRRKSRILNFSIALIINILMIFVIDIINANNVNAYDKLSVYSNSNLLVLLELTSGIFVSWILLSLLISAHNKLKRFDKPAANNKPEIVFEDV